jgi:hypothetical protein
MLKGFEDITRELSEDEREIANVIRKVIKDRTGKENAITNEGLGVLIYSTTGKYVFPARMRKIIASIRRYYEPRLVASKAGYYIAKDSKELNDWVISMRQRVHEQLRALNAAELELLKMQQSEAPRFTPLPF